MVRITKDTSWPDFVSAMSGGGTVDFDRDIILTYDLSAYFKPDNFAWVKVKSGTLINGNGAQVRVYANSLSKATTNNTPRLYVMIEEGNVTIDNLTLHGRASFRITGSNVVLKNCTVDQSNRYSSFGNAIPYNRLDNMYGCFMIYGGGTKNNIEFNNCTAINADHMGFAVFSGSSTVTVLCNNIKYINCKAIGCGSGWEIGGHNPWGRGFDFQESKSPSDGKGGYMQSTFTCIGCCAIDCLQSGFYLEGEYFPQNVSGTIENCHAENCGMRIANAAIAGRNLFDNIGNLGHAIPIPNKVYSGSPDVYGDGFYIPGNIVVKNCTAKNNIIGFTIGDGAYCVNCQDEGSYIGFQTDGGKLQNCTSAKPKYFAAAVYNSLSGGSTLKVIDPPGTTRPLVLTNWVTTRAQRNIHPASYKDLFVADGDVLSCDYSSSKGRYLKPTETDAKISERWTGYGTSSVGSLAIIVNNNSYNRNNAVKAHYTHSSTPSNSTVTFNSNLTYSQISGCGGTIEPPSPTCDEINCGAKQIYDCATKQWVSILETDERYIARCVDKPPGGGGDEGEPTGHYPLVPKPVLQKGIKAKIYARDFGLGGAGKAYSDTVSGNQGSNTTYRNDAPDVDFVTWDDRMEDTDTNKTVIAYTSDGEWLKYPVTVIHCGKYKVTFRVSSGQQNGKIKISADGKYVASVDVPFTSANYATFTNVETTVAVPYIGPNRILKVEFVGDMNLFWFELEHTADEGCEDEPSGPTAPVDYTQHPYNMFSVRNEYGYECNIMAPQYDYGGEGKAYSNVANGREGTYRRGNDTIELFEQSIVTSSNEWVEYTINVSESGNYYFRLETSNMNDANARLEASIVDSYGTKIYGLFNVAVPVSPQEYKKFYAKADAAEKFFLPAGSAVTIRIKFTGEYLFKSLSIVSVDTVEGNIQSRPFKEIDLAALPVTIKPWEFDYGGQGISYLDRSEERSYQKPLRDSDVDVVTVSKPDGGTQTIISGTMKGEWVQYTIKNTTTNEYKDAHLKIQCSTTDPISKIMIVFENEDETKTRDDDGNYVNSYKIQPPITNNFATLHEITLPVKVYKGRNAMKVYFDNNISMGELTFQP